MTTIPTPYYGGGQVPAPPDTIQTSGAPSTANIEHPLGTLAIDNAAANIYGLASKSGNIATWVVLGGTSAGAFPITPFVVGPSGQADYQTVQAAINAAQAAGGGMVYVQPGTYTENLTLYDQIILWGSGFESILVGTHTPPNTGSIGFFRMHLSSATNVVSSAEAGSCSIYFDNCILSVTSGYSANLPSWSAGTIWFNSCYVEGANDGLFNNGSGGATLRVEGNNSLFAITNPVIIGGLMVADSSQIGGPVTGNSGSTIIISDCRLGGEVTFNGLGSIYNSLITVEGATPAINIGNSGLVEVSGSTISCDAANMVVGTGALQILGTCCDSVFTIQNTITLIDDGALISTGDFNLITPGSKVSIATGPNESVGSATLVGGTVTVTTNSVSATSLIFVTVQTLGTVTTAKAMAVTTKTAGTSFVITSADATDTSTVAWWIIN